MNDLRFQNKYRIPSARWQMWDYGSNAAYFITICTAGREHFFGRIENAEMILSEIGKIVESEWLKTPEIRPDMNIVLDEFRVMPNHFHAIIIIGENRYNTEYGIKTTDGDDPYGRRDAMHCVSTHQGTQISDGNRTNHFGPQSKNLGSVMRGFKSAVTTWCRENNHKFAWQPRFHDHVIRDEEEYNRIKTYIQENPQRWEQDKFYS